MFHQSMGANSAKLRCKDCQTVNYFIYTDHFTRCPICEMWVEKRTDKEAQAEWEEIADTYKRIEKGMGFRYISEEKQALIETAKLKAEQKVYFYKMLNGDK